MEVTVNQIGAILELVKQEPAYKSSELVTIGDDLFV